MSVSRSQWINKTANGQRAERFSTERRCAGNLWNLCHRTSRKVLSHAVAADVNVFHGHSLLAFDRRLAA